MCVCKRVCKRACIHTCGHACMCVYVCVYTSALHFMNHILRYSFRHRSFQTVAQHFPDQVTSDIAPFRLWVNTSLTKSLQAPLLSDCGPTLPRPSHFRHSSIQTVAQHFPDQVTSGTPPFRLAQHFPDQVTSGTNPFRLWVNTSLTKSLQT